MMPISPQCSGFELAEINFLQCTNTIKKEGGKSQEELKQSNKTNQQQFC